MNKCGIMQSDKEKRCFYSYKIREVTMMKIEDMEDLIAMYDTQGQRIR